MVLALAHYFPPYPMQLTTAAYPHDHYATQYLVPGGDPDASTVYGGLLRDRPLPPGPLTGDWALANARTEVRQAKGAGLDGFLVDILTIKTDGTDNNSRFGNAIFAAAAAEGGFSCIPMVDMYSAKVKALTPAGLAAVIEHYLAYPSAYHEGSTYFFSAFLSETWTPAQWDDVLTALRDNPDHPDRQIKFVPCFNNYAAISGGTYDGVADGYALWGNRSPAANPTATAVSRGTAAHAKGKLWMQPVSVQDCRPNQSIYDEACNTENLRATAACARESRADWLQLTTWNDYSEGALS